MSATPLRIAVVGGGLAGLAAALRLAEQGMRVELFEARQALGGRGASYRDPDNGEMIDHCQHVAMACCTNFHDFCQRTDIASEFDRYDTLHFISRNGQHYDLRAAWWLPAPLHLASSLLRQGYLTLRERLRIGSALLSLARYQPQQDESIGAWLRRHGQSEAAIANFWSVVLVSALGETIDQASLLPARKVFVDGFMASRHGYQLDVPRRSLRELFDERVAANLSERGIVIHRNAPVESLVYEGERICGIAFARQPQETFDAVVVAVPWRRLKAIIPEQLHVQLPALAHAGTMTASPITGVHLWFDRELTSLPHAVLVDRLSQWVFRRALTDGHYYQVVISASRDLKGMSANMVVEHVVADLAAIFPAARQAKLLASKVVTEQEAVFSYGVGFDATRPTQTTTISNLFLAGDWTQTGWPSTLESAVRSGYLAAEGVLAFANDFSPRIHERTKMHLDPAGLIPDLPRGWLARLLLR